MDKKIVVKAEKSGTMNKEFADFLHNTSNSFDVKAAVINALGWNTNGKLNSNIYSDLIYKKKINESDIYKIEPNDLFVIGYLKAMDDYFNVKEALRFLKQARIKYKDSYTVRIIEALTKAQNVMDKDFCKAWKYTDKVFTNTDVTNDMREDARKIIYDYMVIYKEYCK